jgi:hypothetical protein
MFEDISYPDFNRDDVAICHEIGHLVVWFLYGEPVDKMTIRRSAMDGALEPHVALGITKDLLCDDYAERLAERWLAGESAARKVLNMRRNRISTKTFLVTSQSDLPALLSHMDDREDFARVLWAAHKKATEGWYVWIRERLNQANTMVDTHWGVIQRIAASLQPRLPAAGQEVIISEAELTTVLRHEGITSPLKQ